MPLSRVNKSRLRKNAARPRPRGEGRRCGGRVGEHGSSAEELGGERFRPGRPGRSGAADGVPQRLRCACACTCKLFLCPSCAFVSRVAATCVPRSRGACASRPRHPTPIPQRQPPARSSLLWMESSQSSSAGWTPWRLLSTPWIRDKAPEEGETRVEEGQ